MIPPQGPTGGLLPASSGTDPIEDGAESLRGAAEAAKQKDRSAIPRWVVAVFLAVIVAVLAYVLIGPLVYGWDLIESPAKYAVTTMGSLLLPVVTLVLGYYFGTSEGSP